MIEKEEKKPIRSILQALRELIKVLEDMERKGVTERISSGEIAGLGYTAKYGYRAKLGIEREDFSRTYRKPESLKKNTQIKKESIKIYDKGSTISILTELPFIKEEDFKVKTDGNILKIVANIRKNRIEKSILIEKFGIQKALFKDGILQLELNKEG